MNVKHLVAGVALVSTIVAGLAGGIGQAPRAAHADSSMPTVEMSFNQANPLSVDVLGTNFTPGAAVHLDLFVASVTYGPTPTPDASADPSVTPVPGPTPALVESDPQTVASVDTTAARTINVPNGHGIIFRKVGGYFTTTLTSASPTCGSFSFWVVATDEATGTTYTSGKMGTGASCN